MCTYIRVCVIYFMYFCSMKYQEWQNKQNRFPAMTGIKIEVFNQLLPYFCEAHREYLSQYHMTGKRRSGYRQYVMYKNPALKNVWRLFSPISNSIHYRNIMRICSALNRNNVMNSFTVFVLYFITHWLCAGTNRQGTAVEIVRTF